MNEQQRATMYDVYMYCAMNCAQRATYYRIVGNADKNKIISTENRRYYIRENQNDAAEYYAKAVALQAQQ
jgi:hypothetical protein